MSKKKQQKPFEINSNRCWVCGVEFSERSTGQIGNDKTRHHAVPTQFKPILNVIIPICLKCHNKINKELTHIASVKSKILGLEKYIHQLKEMTERK